MTARLLLAAALLPLLAACADEDVREAVPDEPDASAPERLSVGRPDAAPAQAAPDRRAGVSDALGTFEGGVSGIAVWEHPTLSFASAVIAANGAAGLAVVPIDREVQGSVAPGVFDGPVAVGYTEEAGYVAAASGAEVAFFTIAPDRTLTQVGTLMADPDALCMIGDVLLAVGDEATAYRIGEDGAAAPLFTVAAPRAPFCAATATRFFVGGADAPVTSYTAEGTGALVDDTYAGAAVSGLGAFATPRGPALVFLRDGGLFVDGPGLGHVGVGIVDGDDVMAGADLVAVGSGNYGSIYRDGVVALLSEGRLSLVPWAAVARAAGLDTVETVSFRPRPRTAERTGLEVPPPDIRTTLTPPGAE